MIYLSKTYAHVIPMSTFTYMHQKNTKRHLNILTIYLFSQMIQCLKNFASVSVPFQKPPSTLGVHYLLSKLAGKNSGILSRAPVKNIVIFSLLGQILVHTQQKHFIIHTKHFSQLVKTFVFVMTRRIAYSSTSHKCVSRTISYSHHELNQCAYQHHVSLFLSFIHPFANH